MAADADVGVSRAQKHLGLVAGQIQAGHLAARHQDQRLGRLALVAAGENRRVPAYLMEVRRKMRHHGRFSDAAHGEAADADHGGPEGVLDSDTERYVGAMARAPDPGERCKDEAGGKLMKWARDAFREGFPYL